MDTTKTTIPVEEIREGDRFVREDGVVYWTALTGGELEIHPFAPTRDPFIRVTVQFVDGGTEDRYWDPGTTIEVER